MGSITQADTTTTAASIHDSLQIPRGPVQTKLVFFAPPADGSKPYDYNGRVPEGQIQENYGSDIQEVTVNDIRGHEQEFELNRHGFAVLGDVDTKVENFHQQDQVEEVYYPEVQQLLAREFPGTFVHDEIQIGQCAGLCADPCIRCGRNRDL
jgi:hypothetical protein